MKANAKKELRSTKAFLANLIVPIAYPIAFFLQIVIAYQINPHAFFDLPQDVFILCMLATQTSFWISMDRSIRYLMQDVMSSQFDIVLLKPVNLFFFKYFRYMDLLSVSMMVINYLAFLLVSIHYGLEPLILLKSTVFILLTSVLFLNFKSAIYGITFFSHDAWQVRKLHYAIDDLTATKPAEVFPSLPRFVFTYVVPYLIVRSFIFDLVRGKDDFKFWLTIIVWLAFSVILNKWVWNAGLKKYESMG